VKTLDDLLGWPEQRVELINGEIVRRPMARAEHGLAQTNAAAELSAFSRRGGPGGWWIITEVSVAYELHQCPSHDIAGWRKERMPARPSGVIDVPPDWVCEIVSPGHERKDTLTLFGLLQRHRVPYYWLIWPEDRALIAYALEGDGYRVVRMLLDEPKARVPPFEELELDLAYILGSSEG
jgi:Uma2 family endonuclease